MSAYPDPNCEHCDGTGQISCDCDGCGCQYPNAMPPCFHCTDNHGQDCDCEDPMLVGALKGIDEPAWPAEKLDRLSGIFGIEFEEPQ